MSVAALDMGSNSFNLLIAEVVDQQITPICKVKKQVQLGAGLDADNNLSQQAIDRGVSAVRSFLGLLNEHGVSKVTAAATNTMRLANNRSDFLQVADAILMRPVDVISGVTEAQYIYQAIQNERQFAAKGLVIDIGGGSTEFAVGHGAEIRQENCFSVQVGCVTYSNHYFADGKIYEENISAALASCRMELESIEQRLQLDDVEEIIGTSGTVQSIALLSEEMLHKDAQYIERDYLEDLIKRLISIGTVNDLNFKSIDDSRQKILPAGLCILTAIMNQWDIERIAVGQATLCEGLLLQE